MANLQVATSESWRDKQTGEMREQTEWHRVVLFGKLAEVAGEYLRKGAQVYIEGQLRTRSREDNRNHAGTLSAVQYCQLWLAGTGDAAGSCIRLAGAGAVPGAVIFIVAVLCCMAERCKRGSPRAGRYGHDTAGIVSCA